MSGARPTTALPPHVIRVEMMALSLPHKIALAFGVMLSLLLGMGVVCYRAASALLESEAGLIRAHEILETLERVRSLMDEIESGQRGFIITGDEEYLRPYRAAVGRVGVKLARARELTTGKGVQQQRLDRLEALVRSRLAFAESLIVLREQQGFEAAQRQLRAGEGEDGMAQIRRLVKELKDEERAQLATGRSRVSDMGRSTLFVILAGTALAIVFTLVGGWMTIRDLAKRLRAEQALRVSQSRQELMLGALPVVMYSAKAGEDFGALWVSENVERVSGFPVGAFLQDSHLWAARLHPEDRERTLEQFERLLQGHTLNIEYRWQVADGSYHWFVDRAVLVKGPNASPREILGLWTDITERKGVEDALVETGRTLQAILEASPAAIVSLYPDGRVLSWNPAAERLFGWTAKEVLGKPLPTVSTEDSEQHRRFRERVLRGESFTDIEVVRWTKSGEAVHVSLSAAPLVDAHGCVKGAMGVLLDVTERKLAEKQLSRSRDQLRSLAKRLETVREEECTRIAREIHDELGQALTGLKLDLAWIQRRLSSMDRDWMPAILERLRSTTDLLDSTIQSVRKIATALRPGVLDELGLSAAIEWQAREFEVRTGIRCELSIKPDDLRVDQDRSTAVFRILQEILTNVARHAQASRVVIHLARSDTGVTMEVTDNGRGITLAQRTGLHALGLLGMQERALQFGGNVAVKGAPGKGTSVFVWIPEGAAVT